MSLYSRVIDYQNLKTAWQKAYANKPASGADSVSYDDFNNNLNAELHSLNMELNDHTYSVFPVKLVKIRKEDKIREISLYTMRDKTVQNSVALTITPLYDNEFSSQTFAYRGEKSALNAIGEIEEKIKEGKARYVLKTDVTNFFDNIRHDILRNKLEVKIKDLDLLDLIFDLLKTPSINNDGTLAEKMIGVYQGNSISPLLSNVYLDEFDKKLMYDVDYFARYADDMILLASDKATLEKALITINGLLDELGLSINQDKTYIREIKEGFHFLGYDFDETGKAIPGKAEEKLETFLEDVWLTMVGATTEERLKKGSEILNGWEQYYRGDREIKNIYEYVTVAYMTRHKSEITEIANRRKQFINDNKSIAVYLIKIWQENNRRDLLLLEYEQLFKFSKNGSTIADEVMLNEILDIYSELMKGETEDQLGALMQSYSDLGLFDSAELIMQRIQTIDEEDNTRVSLEETGPSPDEVQFDNKTIGYISSIFVGREDMYAAEYIDENNKRKSEFKPEPFTDNVIKKHLDGMETLETFIVRSNNTAHFMVFDIDICKKYLLLFENDQTSFEMHLKNAAEYAKQIVKCLKSMGIKSYMEFSGFRGYHVWIFFSEWISVKYIYSFFEIVKGKMPEPGEDITVENFPERNKKNSGANGQKIKLPLGIHLRSGKRSYFCDNELLPILPVNDFFNKISKYQTSSIKKAIGCNISDISAEHVPDKKQEIQLDFEKLGLQAQSVLDVLEGCNLMKYLVNKAMVTGYLGHFERLSILDVFGHLGEDGKEFVHTVMAFTLNYQFNITQGFINRIMDKPVSCIKLREQYKQITAEYGCGCNFRRTKDCYPSPVIHALRNNIEENHGITIPTSRHIPTSKQETVYDELNYYSKAEEMANKLVELKKQQRGIERSIKKAERELTVLFDNANTNSMEIDMGILVRRWTDSGWDWLIDI